MFALLTVLHTKQVWLAILLAAVGTIIFATRPVAYESSVSANSSVYESVDRVSRSRSFGPALDKMIEVGFYRPPLTDNAEAEATSGTIAATTLDQTPVLKAMTFVNGTGIAYFHVGGARQSVQENEMIEDWRVASIERSSVLLMRGEETLRLYKYERLPETEPRDSRL
ncbi:MAG: hypothetical protein VXW22_07790 [Pseudomonadota bacterium]|jgi:hypothetical protein|nr:hypothetical protein [Pseudomonadota bacterium]